MSINVNGTVITQVNLSGSDSNFEIDALEPNGQTDVYRKDTIALDLVKGIYTRAPYGGNLPAPTGMSRNVYFAIRTDGIAGTGTIENPYNASTSALFIQNLALVPANSQINLPPGTYNLQPTSFFEGGGALTYGFAFKAGWQFVGSGRGITTIKADWTGVTSSSGHTTQFSLFSCNVYSQGYLPNICISNLTIDCNAGTAGVNLPSGVIGVTAINLMTEGCVIDNVEVIHAYGNGSFDAAIIFLSRGSAGDVYLMRVSRCWIHQHESAVGMFGISISNSDAQNNFTLYTPEIIDNVIEGAALDGNNLTHGMSAGAVNTNVVAGLRVSRNSLIGSLSRAFYTDTHPATALDWIISDNLFYNVANGLILSIPTSGFTISNNVHLCNVTNGPSFLEYQGTPTYDRMAVVNNRFIAQNNPFMRVPGNMTNSVIASNVVTANFFFNNGTVPASVKVFGNIFNNVMPATLVDSAGTAFTPNATFGNLTASTTGFVGIASGSNQLAGTVTLSSGAGTITSTAIDANTSVFLSLKTSSGTPGTYTPRVNVGTGSATVAGLSTDNSTYNWIGMQVV